VHVHLKRGDRGSGRLGTPERVDQPVARYDRVRIQEQQCEQGALLRGSEHERAVVPDYLDRSQDAEFDARSPVYRALKQKLSAPRDGALVT
jgi:hypothetical protein